MKKIKTLTLLTLMLGSIVTTQAQERQNDATWEETVEFLTKYIQNINSYPGETIELKILGEVLEYRRTRGSGNFYYSQKLKLEDVKSIDYDWEEDLTITISSDGNSIETIYHDGNKDFRDWGFFLWKGDNWDKNMVERVVKAFKHLAYLANEKRKESKF